MTDDFEAVAPSPPRRPSNDENNVYGPGWHAMRRADGFALRWDNGESVGRMVEAEIAEEEFDRLRRDPDSFYQIALAHGG